MTLTDDAIERYSRQILLPEIGGRGQERLCATRGIVIGSGDAAAMVASLLAAAGMNVECRPGPPGTLVTTLGEVGAVVARLEAAAATVTTLAGQPCRQCIPPDLQPQANARRADPDEVATAQVVGALVATEALRLALGVATSGRTQVIDLVTGTFAGRPIAATSGCDACAPRA